MLRKLLLSLLFMGFFASATFAQTGSITGTVTNEDGEPVPTANVLLVEITRGAATNLDGEYTIDNVEPGTYTIRITFVGYAEYTDQVTIEAGQTLEKDVTLQTGAVGLEELIVTGYGIRTRAASSASVSSVEGKELSTQPVASVTDALVGKVAGLDISFTTGQPGADGTILLRGISSLNGEVEPLVILNGTPINRDNLALINPNNIEDLTVLKDASATAIYGNRGANGVIVIRTKRGEYNTGLRVSYSADIRSTSLRKEDYDLLTGPEYLRLARDLARLQTTTLIGNGDDTITDEEIANAPTTDWIDYYFDPSLSQQHSISISNGQENIRYYASFGFLTQDGALDQTSFDRYNLRTSISGRSDDNKFNFSLNMGLSYLNNKTFTSLGTGGINQNPLLAAKQAVPYLAPSDYPGSGQAFFDQLGIFFVHTPLFIVDKMRYNTNDNREEGLVGNLETSYDLLENLTLTARIGAQYERDNDEFTRSSDSFNSILFATPDNTFTAGEASNTTTRTFAYNFNVNLRYRTMLSDVHSLDAAAYFEVAQSYYKTYGFTSNGLLSLVYDPGDGAGFIDDNPLNDVFVDNIELNSMKAGLLSYFGTLGYMYDYRYGIDLTIRRDASYRFIGGNKWGTFPSVGVYWNISNEEFMDGSVFDYMKLRASYGVTGNQDLAGEGGQFASFGGATLTQSLYEAGGGYGGLTSFLLDQIGNPALRWETVYQTNVGLDIEMFNSRLEARITAYRKVTEDLFQDLPVSAITSITELSDNVGSLENRGLEVELFYDVLQSIDGLNVRLGFVGAYNKIEILELPQEEDGRIIDGDEILREGGTIGEYFIVPYAGVNPETGNLLYVGADGELTETPLLPDAKVATGRNIYPEFQGSFSLDLGYQGFFFQTDWEFALGIDRFDNRYAGLISPGNLGQFQVGADLLNYWTPDNRETDIPSLNASNTNIDSDRFLRSSDYFRLRFAKIGYQFPVEFTQALSIRSATIYVSGTNLFALTPWKGLDPATQSSNDVLYPNPRIFSAGFNINF